MEIPDYIRRFDEAIQGPAQVLAAHGLFTQLASDRPALHAALVELLRNLAHDGLFLPRSVMEAQVVLSPMPRPEAHYDLAIGRYAAAGSSVVTHCVYGLFAPLGDTLRVEHYRLPAEWDCAIFSDTMQMERLDDFEVARGEVFAIAPGRDTYRLRAPRPNLVLKLVSRPIVPFEWSFDERTLLAWQSISTIPPETHLVHACRAAAALGEPALARSLEPLTRHPRHIVRWEALRSLCQLDRDLGLAALETLSDDLHPHVHRAARRAHAEAMQEA